MNRYAQAMLRAILLALTLFGVSDPSGLVAFGAQLPNRPLVLNSIADQTVNEGQRLSLTLSAPELALDALTYELTKVCTKDVTSGVLACQSGDTLPNASLDAATGIFSWQPDFTQAGVYALTFTVSSGGLTASETMSITVLNAVNLVTNGGFEQGKTDWTGWGSRQTITTETAVEGTHAAKIILHKATQTLDHVNFPVTAGQSYQFSAWVKHSMAYQTNGSPGCTDIRIYWYAENSSSGRFRIIAQTPFNSSRGSPTTDWSQLIASATAPTAAVSARVHILTPPGTGAIFIDDIRLE